MKPFFNYIRRGTTVLIFFSLAMLVYATMILGPLNTLQQISGQAPFDLRPTGYSLADAQNLIAALGEEGRSIYLTQQIPLDILYPAFLAIFMSGAIVWFSRNFTHTAKWYRYIACLAFAAALADYIENALIVSMLTSSSLTAPLVNSASMFSITKAALTTIVSLILLLAIIEFILRKKIFLANKPHP